MSTPFNPHHGLILLTARIWGPTGDTYARLALDTGATSTVLREAKLASVGYNPAAVPTRVPITTGSGVQAVASLVLDRIEALGKQRVALPVLCHTLPPSAPIDGLLGLDFLRGQSLTIDFGNGLITLI